MVSDIYELHGYIILLSFMILNLDRIYYGFVGNSLQLGGKMGEKES